MPDIAAVGRFGPGAGGVKLGFFHLVRPARRAPGRRLQASDLAAKPLVLGGLARIAVLHLLPPGGKVALPHAQPAALDGQHVVAAGVQQRAVVRDEQEALRLPAQIPPQQRTPGGVEVVGRFVDQRVAARLQKQQGQQRAGLLPLGQGVEPARERFGAQAQQAELAGDAPVLGPAQRGGHLAQRARGVGHRAGKAAKVNGGGDLAFAGQFPLQQPQQRGLAAAVAAGQAQLPARVKADRSVLEHVIVAAGVVECDICQLDHGHGAAPPFLCSSKKRTAGEGTPRGPHAAPFKNGARHKKEAAECAVSPLQNGTTKQTAPQSAAIPRGPAGKQNGKSLPGSLAMPLRALCSPCAAHVLRLCVFSKRHCASFHLQQ